MHAEESYYAFINVFKYIWIFLITTQFISFWKIILHLGNIILSDCGHKDSQSTVILNYTVLNDSHGIRYFILTLKKSIAWAKINQILPFLNPELKILQHSQLNMNLSTLNFRMCLLWKRVRFGKLWFSNLCLNHTI